MGMVSGVLAGKDFSNLEEANQFLNEAFSGRTMSDSLAEWDTRPPTALDEARAVVNRIPGDATVETARRAAKKSLEITPDCMEAWEILAWSYRSPAKIKATLLEGIAHGRDLHVDLIAEVEEDHGLWGYHQARPFMILLSSLADFYDHHGPLEKVVEVYEEMMSLNPGDNQGVRGQLLHKYICLERYQEAEALAKRYGEDSDLGIVYGRVLLELVKVVNSGYEFEGLLRKKR
ncbi:MAG: hypothetical protein AAF514_00015 [Verrucomicrobiota bacterium]